MTARMALSMCAAALPIYSVSANANETETTALASTAGLVERDGSRLYLRLRSGETKILIDGPSCRDARPSSSELDRCYGYEFNRYDAARDLFVVQRYYYEGGDYILVDARAGEEATLQADPELSPMGDVALELVYGESRYYAGNPAMNIWRRTSGRFVRAWSQPIAGPDDYYFSVLGWVSNDRVDIEKITPPSFNRNGATKRFSLIRDGSVWRLIDR